MITVTWPDRFLAPGLLRNPDMHTYLRVLPCKISPVQWGTEAGEGKGGQTWWKYYVFVYENGKRPVLRRGEG
jgi:hypothetical protein